MPFSLFHRAGWRAAAVAALLALVSPAFAEVVTIMEETPSVTVDVPEAFATSKTTRGVQAKTSNEEVFVWFETYAPDEADALIKEHDDYWVKSGVEGGAQTDRVSKQVGNKTVIATDYKGATWKGKPTVIRYLFIDPGLPSKRLVLMSLWASPEGDQEHDSEIIEMISSLKIRE